MINVLQDLREFLGTKKIDIREILCAEIVTGKKFYIDDDDEYEELGLLPPIIHRLKCGYSENDIISFFKGIDINYSKDEEYITGTIWLKNKTLIQSEIIKNWDCIIGSYWWHNTDMLIPEYLEK